VEVREEEEVMMGFDDDAVVEDEPGFFIKSTSLPFSPPILCSFLALRSLSISSIVLMSLLFVFNACIPSAPIRLASSPLLPTAFDAPFTSILCFDLSPPDDDELAFLLRPPERTAAAEEEMDAGVACSPMDCFCLRARSSSRVRSPRETVGLEEGLM
jgi:hypothetical protein